MLRVQVYETLQILLQEGRTHARNGDTVAVTELEHRVAMHVGSNRGRQFLHIMNVGELVELDRVVLWIEVVDRLRALARVEYKGVVAGAANGDWRDWCWQRPAKSKMIVPPWPSEDLFQITEVEIVYRDSFKDRMGVFFIVMIASPSAPSEKQTLPTAT